MMDYKSNIKANIKNLSYESLIAVFAVFAVLIPLAIFSAISLYSSSHALTEVIKKELEDKSILVAYDINNFISERISDAKAIALADVLESDDIVAQTQYLSEIVKQNKWIEDVDIFNIEGSIIVSSGTTNETKHSFFTASPANKRLYLSAIKASQGDVYVSEAKILDSGPAILFVTPIVNNTNTKIIGLLALEINLNKIARIISLFNNEVAGGKYVYIVDNTGKIIISDDPSVKFLDIFPDLKVQPELLKDFSAEGSVGSIIYNDSMGDLVMTGYADMIEFGLNNALDWSIVAIAPMDIITAPVSGLKQQLLIVGIIIAILATLIAYRIVVAFTGALEKIATQAGTISRGDYSKPPLRQTKRKGAFNTLIIAFNLMVTNIRQLINELRDREQKLDITLNSIGDGVIATDEKGNVTRMNPAAEKLTGWPFKDAEGLSVKNIFSIVHETSRKPIDNPIDEVIASGNTVYLSNHITLISRNGMEYQIEDSAAAIRDVNNNILGMILIFSDVTQRKLAEKQYRRASKMDALGKLTGGVAHDYNNMLGVIMGYSELLKVGLKDQPAFLEYIDVILDSAERGASMTNKLLGFSRLKPSETTSLNLNTLLQDHQLMLDKTLTARIELVLKLSPNLWFVCLDESDTIDSILNICINAMHAIEDNGCITIHTSNEHINKMDEQEMGIPSGDYVLLSLSDTGCGMDDKTKEKIYDPFFTTKGKKGTGLGLSQVYGFVQRSKGAIKLYSELGHGTCQALYFPRQHTENQQQSPIITNTSTIITGTETILVVDDEVKLVNFSCKVLEQYGFTILSAESAQHALQLLKHEKVDLLFSDIIMPEMNGYQLAMVVKEKYPEIKIQLTSGFADDRNADNIDETLRQNILLKPYNTQSLLEAIHDLLNNNSKTMD